ncbi:MAG: extracellular solute-binding protein, partial [Pseudomonadota bacterium]
NEPLIKPLFDRYTELTGVEVRFVTDSAGPLLQRLEAEGSDTPADILLTVDAGNLWQAAQRGLLQAVDSPVLTGNVPAHLRDPDNAWFGLSVRARTIVYNTRNVTPNALSTYEALAEPQWKGRLCLRTSKKVYNQSLVAMMIAEKGEAQTEAIVKGWVDNLAAEPFANDTAVLEAVAVGQCDVGIVNSYYFGRLMKEDPRYPLKLFWPNQDGAGVHVNVSGAGVVAGAGDTAAAVAFLEWLSSPEAQGEFAGVNLEYPVNPAVPNDPAVEAWGDFVANTINVSEAGALQADAVRLMDRAKYR